ncbi:hypothetical protein JG687_00010448 [Phytophthora cactorum]|uniref:Uncharacterized protein n=1 Tax=Phytophthora cactorum TaxID=29920 RepID=A0A329SBG6_9STRA|nr:hypothetical protein GQ600_14262 [Phytophthora cactorum]KAG2770583.1 hypothetical protein Pcac1_g18198 [Phytophthora cactorum]KAG2842309.1 hypothetical protein PC112_g3044 [Phytophthora cactorum]KAG2922689.1 hypothetical protein PC114_g5134 [Phytophthora cactorum]KAG2933361.1 hypothetical protein PC115_g5511 [Phytophthora cactorum]
MARVVTISSERVEDVIELAKHAGELTRTVRAHMYQNNFILAFRAFEQLPHLEAMHLWYIEEIIRSFFLGLIDMQTLLNFFGILPTSLWALEGVEKLHSSIEMCVEAGHFQTRSASVQWYLLCVSWLASPTVRAIIAGGEFVVESVSRGEIMYAPVDGYDYSSDTRPVFTWVPRPYRHDGNRQERWRIVQVHDAENCFLIQNVAFGEYLYATFRGRPGREQSMVSLWRSDYQFDDDEKEMFYWQLIPVDQDNREVFALYNRYQKEFLFAPDVFHDQERRFVRTSQANVLSIQQRQWRLILQASIVPARQAQVDLATIYLAY